MSEFRYNFTNGSHLLLINNFSFMDNGKGCLLCKVDKPIENISDSIALYKSPKPIVVTSKMDDLACLKIFEKYPGIGVDEWLVLRHGKTPADLSIIELEKVFSFIKKRLKHHSEKNNLEYTSFVWDGSTLSGFSEHSYIQLVGLPVIPYNLYQKTLSYVHYYHNNDVCLPCDLTTVETALDERIVLLNKYFVALVPFAPTADIEIVIYPLNHSSVFYEISSIEIKYLCDMMYKIFKILKNGNILDITSIYLHSIPNKKDYIGKDSNKMFHWSIDIVTARKKLTGFELSTGINLSQTSPEDITQYLRSLEGGV